MTTAAAAAERHAESRPGFGGRLAALWYGSPLYGLTLPRQAPLEFLSLPDDPWPGLAARADRLFQGRFGFAGLEVVSPHAAPWDSDAESLNAEPASIASWAAELHGFAWLRDFAAQGGDMAQRMSRSLVQHWIERHHSWRPRAWAAPVMGRRLASWLNAGHFLLQNADAAFGHDLLLSVARQAAHLGRVAHREPQPAARAEALLGLVYAAESLPGGPERWPLALPQLILAWEAQLLGDGGHVSRNPSRLLAQFRDVVALQRYLSAGHPERMSLLPLMDRMAPMLRFFRHGDGGLALFHGSEEEPSGALDHALALSETLIQGKHGKPPTSSAASGFERLVAKRALLLLDTGAPPLDMLGRPHAAPLAFEFSHGKDRLFVNCGASRRLGGDWAEALAGPAAHNTLGIEHARPAPHFTVRLQRHEQDGHAWVEAEHDGWQPAFGLLHKRRLYLGASGDDLRGEDSLEGGAPDRPRAFTLRFHLHPGMHASVLGTGDTVLLKTNSGQGWRWRGQGGVVRLEDSVYFGQGGELRRTQQIVMAGSAAGLPVQLKWALTKIPA